MADYNTNILSSYIVNTDAFEAIKSEIESNAHSPIPQPIIAIGQDGSGKTTLLRKLYKICDERNRIWIDGRSIFSSEFIIEQCSHNNASVVFIDDLDYYLTRCNYDEQFRLRRFLNEEGAPMLISSAHRLYPALVEYEAPFFEGLKKIFLNPIPEDKLRTLFGDSNLTRVLQMYELISPTIKSLLLIDHILIFNDSPNQDIPLLLSFYEDIFKNVYNSLPAYSQHILNVLNSNKSGMNLSQIREKSGLSTNILTAYLSNLRKHGIVKVDKCLKRNNPYFVKDPLFGIWLKSKTQDIFDF